MSALGNAICDKSTFALDLLHVKTMPDDEIKTQIEGMKKLVELSQTRTNQSAQRSYQNAERTLSVWVRTAIGAMIFGIAIDRLGLMAYEIPKDAGAHFAPSDVPFMLIGVALMIYSVVMALTFGIRFLAYARDYKKQYSIPTFHNEWPPVISAFMVAIFGAIVLLFMIWYR
jgi:uncharacterized membrane protein YidH (DUF202 family)